MKTFKKLTIFGVAAMLAVSMFFGTTAQAAKSGGTTWPGKTLYTFTYNIGTVTNYHAYIEAGACHLLPEQPTNTIILAHYWYVKDLGPISGTGTVACPGQIQFPSTGNIFLAEASDTGGPALPDDTFTYPIAMIQVTTGRSGFSSVQVVFSPKTVCDSLGQNCYLKTPGVSLLNTVPLTSFSYDVSAYLWNVMPTNWMDLYYQY